MYVYVLETFDRNDRHCEYDSEVIAVYSEEHLKEAKKHWEELCDIRIDEDDEVDKWQRNGDYLFSSKNGECENYRYSFVGLRKMEVK